jgi:hypothetical protein
MKQKKKIKAVKEKIKAILVYPYQTILQGVSRRISEILSWGNRLRIVNFNS